MAKLSLSRAWDEARGVLGRHGGLLATIALALLVLPGVVSDLVTPAAPPGEFPKPGAWLIVAAIAVLIGLVGQLAIVRLALGTSGTVGEAIGHGARRAPAYIAATLIWALPVAVALALLAGQLRPESPSPAAAIVVLLLMPLVIFLFVRLILTAPVATAEQIGPVAILKRSWELSRGNWWRLFGFVCLLVIAAIVVIVAVGAMVGILASLLFGEVEPMSIGALVVSLLTQIAAAAITVVFVVMLARIYAQLASRGERSAEASVPSSGT